MASGHHYQGKVVLLMDGLGSGNTDRFLEQFAGRAVDVIFLVPDASHQT
jgi:hypothetical protein